MTAISYIESVKSLPLNLANIQMETFCGISNFFRDADDICSIKRDDATDNVSKEEYGDWQTSMELALSVCRLLKEQGINPHVIVEPTCGKGHFILAALQTFDSIEDIYGIEIYEPYLEQLKVSILQYYLDNPNANKVKINLFHQNVFDFNFNSIKKCLKGRNVLVIGNPPWVTNSKLGIIQSGNLPVKSNFKKVKGLNAITGKGNFDIAEYICSQMIDFLEGECATLALLVKTSVIKNIVYEQKNSRYPITSITQYNIDAKKEFGVSVAAALLYAEIGNKANRQCIVRDFYSLKCLQEYGWVGNSFVSDIISYAKYHYMDGKSPFIWWSGVKHDCSKVMELTLIDGKYVNGLGQIVNIESDLVYPLVKSSDIKEDQISNTRKYVIVTQKSTNEDTGWIRQSCPLAYDYLNKHAEYLDKRGSSIYKNRPRFCLFGIGDYSFKKYKVVVSGLYKKPHFSLVGEIDSKPVMLDDTCYLLGFDNYEEARVVQSILNSNPVQLFIQSLLFVDAKRVINKDLLMRIDFMRILEYAQNENLNVDKSDLEKFLLFLKKNSNPTQFELF